MGDGIDRLRHLVDELLDASRRNPDPTPSEAVTTDLRSLIQESVETLRVRQEHGSYRPGMRVVERLPDTAVTGPWDGERLRRAVLNLLDNAMNYAAPDGVVTIELSAEDEEGIPEARQAHVVVRDTGIGIPADHLTRIFDRYARAPNAARHTGFGLGLAVARDIVVAMSGEIWGESDGAGRGAAFHVVLPGALIAEEVDGGDSPAR